MEFRWPSMGCRPAPFWSWNDALVEDELRWQVQQLKAAGYGGFFMHPRVGLETEYPSETGGWGRRLSPMIAGSTGMCSPRTGCSAASN